MTKKYDCTYIGHGTVLSEIGDCQVLTDPNFDKRALFSKRKVPLEINLSTLDHISSVLVSHMHYSHLNLNSFKYISAGTPVIVPEGTEPVIGRLISNPIIELNHWSTHELVDHTKITAVPVIHRGGRFSQLRYTGSNGYIVEKDGITFFFCGDSAYGQHFTEIGNLYKIDVALLPIGAYEPRWLMKRWHMTPAEAVTAFEDLNAAYFIPIHWGTFRLSMEKPNAPVKWLNAILEDRPDLKKKIFILNPGQSKSLTFDLESEKKERKVENKLSSVTSVSNIGRTPSHQ